MKLYKFFLLFNFLLTVVAQAGNELKEWEKKEADYPFKQYFVQLPSDIQKTIIGYLAHYTQEDFENSDEWLKHRLTHMEGGAIAAKQFKLIRTDGTKITFAIDNEAIVSTSTVKNAVVIKKLEDEAISFIFSPSLYKLLVITNENMNVYASNNIIFEKYITLPKKKIIQKSISHMAGLIQEVPRNLIGVAISDDGKKIAFLETSNKYAAQCVLLIQDSETGEIVKTKTFFDETIKADRWHIKSFSFNRSATKIGAYFEFLTPTPWQYECDDYWNRKEEIKIIPISNEKINKNSKPRCLLQ